MEEKRSFFEVIIAFFQDGGVFMIPIGIVLFVGLAVVIERWLFLSAAKSTNRRAFDRIMPMLKKRDFKGVIQVARSSEAPVSKIIAAGVARMDSTRRREDIELAMEEGVMEATPRLEKRTGYLATLANIATLLGLLGTIIGLIRAFEAVAQAAAEEKAELLSASISTAMNTTAFGLIAAIPLLLFHSYLQNKTLEIIDGLEMAGVKCLNAMALGKPGAEAAPRPAGK